MSPNSRLPNKARASDLARMAICLSLIFITATITFIVFRGLLKDASDSGLERRKEVAADDEVELGTHLSDEGEELEAWLVRIAPILATHTQESGHEACGYIAQNQDGSRYGIRLTTSKGALTCVVDPTRVPEGMTALRATFHSHPQRSIVLPTAADELHYRANPLPSGQWIKRARPVDLGNSTFSAADYAAGAGYVVTKGRVFFQSGKGTDREVGALVH